MLCYVTLRYVMLCYVMLCYVMLCYVMLCYVMLCLGSVWEDQSVLTINFQIKIFRIFGQNSDVRKKLQDLLEFVISYVFHHFTILRIVKNAIAIQAPVKPNVYTLDRLSAFL